MPQPSCESENKVIALTGLGSEKPFMVLIADTIIDLHLVGAGSTTQCFPFYIYDEHGLNRRENITDSALRQFRGKYKDDAITKWNLFDYVYGVLHLPSYRMKFADNLKKELPRIPLAADFRAIAEVGKRLAELYLDYEKAEPWELGWVHAEGKPLSYRVGA